MLWESVLLQYGRTMWRSRALGGLIARRCGLAGARTCAGCAGCAGCAWVLSGVLR